MHFYYCACILCFMWYTTFRLFCFCFPPLSPIHNAVLHGAPLLAVTCMLMRLNPIGPLPSCARCLLFKDSIDFQSNEATPRGDCRPGTSTFCFACSYYLYYNFFCHCGLHSLQVFVCTDSHQKALLLKMWNVFFILVNMLLQTSYHFVFCPFCANGHFYCSVII